MVMYPGPFLSCEMVTSVRCARVIRDRLIALLPVAGGVAGCVVVWAERALGQDLGPRGGLVSPSWHSA